MTAKEKGSVVNSLDQTETLEAIQQSEEDIKARRTRPVKKFLQELRLENDALDRAVAKMMNRSPEEKAAARARLFQQSRAPREVAEGQTLNDVVYGKWPGDETDEQILEALEKLS